MDNSSRTSSLTCPSRLFVCDSDKHVESLVRIMGCVVSVTPWQDDCCESKSFSVLELDDGTGTLRAACPSEMLSRLKLQSSLVGTTLDCVGTVVNVEEIKDGGTIFVTTTVALVKDVHAETLRWLEICLSAQNQNENTSPPDSHIYMAGGFQPPSLCAQDVGRYIKSGAMDGGVTMEDLSMVCSVDMNEMQAMVQELQLKGEVYQNRQGKFLPL